MKKIFFCFGVISFSLLIFQATPNFADASAWWGTGARDKDWILKRGGTLIRYEIKNTKKSDDIVARMYLLGATGAGGGASQKAKAGDLIETESGKSATFDDAINNKYEIKIFQNEKLKLSTKVVARPGEILKLTFNLKNDSIEKESQVVYSRHEISLNAQSAKYIDSASLGNRKPFFKKRFPETLIITKDEKIQFEARDNETGIDYYRVQLWDKDGRVVRDWNKQSQNFYFIPEAVVDEVSVILVRAYDQAGNYVEQKARLNIIEKKLESSLEEDIEEDQERFSAEDEDDESEEDQFSVEQKTWEKSLFVIENEIEPLKLKIERNFEKANRKNFLAYVFLGPDKKEIEKIESKLEEVYEKIILVDEMKKNLPINDVRFELEGRRNFWENFLENKKIALEKSRSDLKFWNRISSLLKTQSTFETRIESV
jgi:hypothetical protein